MITSRCIILLGTGSMNVCFEKFFHLIVFDDSRFFNLLVVTTLM